MIERTTVRLPSALLARAKSKARAEGTTLTAPIEDGLRLAIARNPKTAARRIIDLPVSSAAGGLPPGRDLVHNAALQEEEDREAFVRAWRSRS